MALSLLSFAINYLSLAIFCPCTSLPNPQIKVNKRLLCTGIIRTAKKDFFAKSIAENKDNAYLWKHVKDINGKSNENKLPDELTTNGISTTDPHMISETLNNFFSTISEKLKSEHPQENPEFDTINLDDYIKEKIPSSVQFGIPLMKLANLTSALKALDVTKATGLDGITPRILKTTAETVAPTLLDIINVSLMQICTRVQICTPLCRVHMLINCVHTHVDLIRNLTQGTHFYEKFAVFECSN